MSYLSDLQDACKNLVCTVDEKNLNYEAMIKHCIGEFQKIKRKGNLLYFIGNGGSAGISVHMTSDYLKKWWHSYA